MTIQPGVYRIKNLEGTSVTLSFQQDHERLTDQLFNGMGRTLTTTGWDSHVSPESDSYWSDYTSVGRLAL